MYGRQSRCKKLLSALSSQELHAQSVPCKAWHQISVWRLLQLPIASLLVAELPAGRCPDNAARFQKIYCESSLHHGDVCSYCISSVWVWCIKSAPPNSVIRISAKIACCGQLHVRLRMVISCSGSNWQSTRGKSERSNWEIEWQKIWRGARWSRCRFDSSSSKKAGNGTRKRYLHTLFASE